MLARGLMSSAITLGLLVGAAVAGDQPGENAKLKELEKQLVALRQAAAGAAETKQVDDARKQLAEAQKRLAEAQKTVEVAQKIAEDAQKKVAEHEKAVAEAQRRLAEAQRRAAEAARRAAARLPNYGASYAVRQTVDRTDPVERLLVLTPAGPLVVEASMTIDGQSFREPREKLVDELLAVADTNKDGKSTWAEAAANSRNFIGQLQYFGNEEQRKQYLESLDLNKDGIVDRYEARMMIAGRSGGGDFILTASPAYGLAGVGGGGGVVVTSQGQVFSAGGAGSDLRALLDTDGDGTLSAKEIAAAPERLKSRDADDNDVLESTEIGGGAATGRRTGTVAARPAAGGRTGFSLAVLLGPTANAANLLAALKQAYGDKDGRLTAKSFPALRKLFEAVDANHDGEWKEDEVLGLNRTPPHVRLKISFGKNGQGLVIDSLAEIEKPAEAGGSNNAVVVPGVKLAFLANPAGPQTIDYSNTAKSYMAAYDKNQNGYIDKEEMAGNLAGTFAMWDANDDGKVYAEEIAASFNRQNAPLMSQVRATVTAQGNSLFAALDANGDGRLGLREMRNAPERIRAFDKNHDGQVTPDEIPLSMTVSFGVGNAGYYTYAQGGGGQPAGRGASRGPDWFTRMDRNNDGDVTEREFLGTPEQFKKLDTNGDGFIDRSEAEAAKK
jgi:Ca2+-binding EF-hand superfamily protein